MCAYTEKNIRCLKRIYQLRQERKKKIKQVISRCVWACKEKNTIDASAHLEISALTRSLRYNATARKEKKSKHVRSYCLCAYRDIFIIDVHVDS